MPAPQTLLSRDPVRMTHSAPWDALAARTRQHGPVPSAGDQDVERVLQGPTLVGLPDGRISHVVHALDGQWLTQRVRARTAGRTDLWVTSALAPLVTALIEAPLPLASGGELREAAHFQSAVIGPPGWLPDVPAGGLVGLRLSAGVVDVRAVPDPEPDPVREQSVRELIARHYRTERWWSEDEPATRRTLTRAIVASVLEQPDLFSAPSWPLDELLLDPLREQHRHHWRDDAAWQTEGGVSLSLVGVPDALYTELTKRAAVYGMSLDQYVIAVLGHLAWRTPFAEDLEPWDGWLPDLTPGAAILPLPERAPRPDA